MIDQLFFRPGFQVSLGLLPDRKHVVGVIELGVFFVHCYRFLLRDFISRSTRVAMIGSGGHGSGIGDVALRWVVLGGGGVGGGAGVGG